MKRLGLILVLVSVGAYFSLQSPTQRYTPVVSETMTSVVKITSSYLTIENGAIIPSVHLGSGVLITSKGHILTCEHVVHGHPAHIGVTLYGNPVEYTALVIRADQGHDIALLRIVQPVTGYPTRPLAKREPKVGDEVVAIGMPYGYEWSASAGIISGLNRDGLTVNLTQTDAAINPGNSGGPLFNLQGEIVGINEAKINDNGNASNMGFAVSLTTIRRFLSLFSGLAEVQ